MSKGLIKAYIKRVEKDTDVDMGAIMDFVDPELTLKENMKVVKRELHKQYNIIPESDLRDNIKRDEYNFFEKLQLMTNIKKIKKFIKNYVSAYHYRLKIPIKILEKIFKNFRKELEKISYVIYKGHVVINQ